MAKKGKLVRSASAKVFYKTYSSRYEKNRLRDLMRHVEKNPNDKQAAARLDNNAPLKYRRNKHNKATKDQPKMSPERQARHDEMLKRELKSLKREVPEYVKVLRKLRDAMRPKVKYKGKYGKRKAVHKGS